MEYRELEALPPYGPAALPFSRSGQGMHQQGYVVEFFPETDRSWVGNFSTGLSSFSTACAHPNQQDMVIISGGEGYILNPATKQMISTFGGMIDAATYSSSMNAIIFTDAIRVYFLGAKNNITFTRRISWDGIKDIQFNDHSIHGNAYDPMSNEWKSFEVSLPNLSITGGTYPKELPD